MGTLMLESTAVSVESTTSYWLLASPYVKRTLYAWPCNTPCVPTLGAGNESWSKGYSARDVVLVLYTIAPT